MKLLRVLTCSAFAALALAIAGCSDDSPAPAAIAATAADNAPADSLVTDPVAAEVVVPEPVPDEGSTDPVATEPAPADNTDPAPPAVVVPDPIPDPVPPVVAVPDPVPDPVPPEDPVFVPGAEISGQVMKGVTANAIVTVYAPDGSGGFVQLASTLSNAQGAYALTLPFGYAGAIKIVASATMPPDAPTKMRCDAASGCGTFPEATADDINGNGLVDFGDWFVVDADFSLRAVATVDALGIHFVNLTPLSSLAADWAEQFPQGLDARSVLAANEQVAVAFGFAVSDLESPLGDITDPLWLILADPQQVKLSLVMATFAEIAAHFGIGTQFVIDTFATAFVDQQGTLLEASTTQSPSIAVILGTAATLAGTLDMPAATQTDIELSIALAMETLQPGVLTGHGQVTAGRLLAPLGAMGQQLDVLLARTGLESPQNFVLQQAPYFSWLLADDNLQLIPLGVETAIWSMAGMLLLDIDATPATMDLANDGVSRITLDKVGKRLLVTGVRHGQDVDLAVALTGLKAGAEAHHFNFGIVGTIANPTASGSIDGTLVVDTGATNMTMLISAIEQIQAGNPLAGLTLKAALVQLARSAAADVSLVGTAQLVRSSDPAQVLGGEVALTASVNLGAAVGETIATLTVASADLVLPNGDHYYGLPGTPVLTATVGDDATVVIDGAATALGLPEATAHAEGTLVNARALFVHVRDTLVTQLSSETPDLNATITALLAFDLSQLAVHGTGIVEIPELGHEYRAALDNFVVTVYQPHSEEVAMTATLDLDQQAVHLMLGDEPWDLKLMTTPTPSVVLLGPDGQFETLSQEDFYSLLDSVPLGRLLAGIGGTTP